MQIFISFDLTNLIFCEFLEIIISSVTCHYMYDFLSSEKFGQFSESGKSPIQSQGPDGP